MNDPETLTSQAAGSDGWSRTDHLLAFIVDELRLANWQRTKDGAKGSNRPKPISPLAPSDNKTVTYGKTELSPEDVIAYFDKLHGRTGKDREPWQLKSVQHM